MHWRFSGSLTGSHDVVSAQFNYWDNGIGLIGCKPLYMAIGIYHNSLTLGKFGDNYQIEILEFIILIEFFSTSCEIYFRCIRTASMKSQHGFTGISQISGHSPIKILKVQNISKLQDNFCIYQCELYMPFVHLRSKCPETKFVQEKTWVRYGLGAVRQQAITWASVDPKLHHHMASLGQKLIYICRIQSILAMCMRFSGINAQ